VLLQTFLYMSFGDHLIIFLMDIHEEVEMLGHRTYIYIYIYTCVYTHIHSHIYVYMFTLVTYCQTKMAVPIHFHIAMCRCQSVADWCRGSLPSQARELAHEAAE
jgi:hypothetical protein